MLLKVSTDLEDVTYLKIKNKNVLVIKLFSFGLQRQFSYHYNVYKT